MSKAADLPKIQPDLKTEIEKKKELSHVETKVKNPLPDEQSMKAEKQHEAFIEGIQNFEPEKLKNVEPEVKNKLPTKEEIEAEKNAKNN